MKKRMKRRDWEVWRNLKSGSRESRLTEIETDGEKQGAVEENQINVEESNDWNKDFDREKKRSDRNEEEDVAIETVMTEIKKNRTRREKTQTLGSCRRKIGEKN